MLAALDKGVKGNRWFSLIDSRAQRDSRSFFLQTISGNVYADRTLELAWEKVSSNAGACGVDGITVERLRAKTAKVGCSP